MRKNYTKQFGLFAVLFLISSFSKAQFMCTDIAPDSVVTFVAVAQHSYEIDVNNDAVKDYQFSTQLVNATFGFVILQTGVTNMSQNFVMVSGSNSVSALNAGAPIGPSSTVWKDMVSSNPSIISLAAGPPQGTWAGAIDKYVGVAIAVSTNTFYGWIKMSASSSICSYTVKEYGFNSVPGASIAAGQACAPPFTVSFTTPSVICLSQSSLNLIANTGTVVPTSINWTNSGSAFFLPQNSATTTIVFPTSGTYVITVTAMSGTTTVATSNTVIVYPNPVISIVSSQGSAICASLTTVLTASGSANSFTWNTSANTSTISVTPTTVGTQSYSVTGSLNGCTNTAVFTLSVANCPIGLNQLNEVEYGFTLFPNPVTDVLAIRSNYGLQKNIEITVLDIIGKIHLRQELICENQNSVQQLNVSTLPKGVYFVKLKAENGNYKVIRILKE